MTIGTRETAASPRSVTLSSSLVRGGDLPAGFVVGLAVVIALASVAGTLDWSVLHDRTGALVVLTFGALAGAASLWLSRGATAGADGLRAGVLAVPGISVLAVAVVGAMRGAPHGFEWLLNGDHPRHVVYVADTWVQGNLTYAVDGYPRGWHSALAAGWAVVGAGLDALHVSRLLELMATTSLLLSAALALATAHLAHALAARMGLSGDAQVVVGGVAGALSLLNVFLANYQALGYQNSLLAALALAVCCRELLVRAGTTASLVVCASGVAVVAHSWQLLLPPVGVALLWCAVVGLRSGNRGPRRAATVLVPLSIALGAPGVLAVASGVGLDHAAEVGPDSPVPVALLTLGVGAVLDLLRRRRDPATACFAVVSLLPAATAAALAVVLDLDLLHYYPSKLLWQSALLVMPSVVVLVTLLAAPVLRRRTTAGSLIRVTAGVLTGLLSAYALALPWGSQVGAWSTVDGGRVLAAIAAREAPDAVVVWLEGSPTTDSVARSLLDVFRVEQTRARAPQARLSVADECALLRGSERPVVLSSASQESVSRRYSCVPDVEVRRVTGD